MRATNIEEGPAVLLKRVTIALIAAGLACAIVISPIFAFGEISEFPVPTIDANPEKMTSVPGGAVWFTEFIENRIARVTPDGVVSEFVVPTALSEPDGITLGPDGNLWFTEFAAGKIGRLTSGGVFVEFALPNSQSGPSGITQGADGNLWFTELTGNAIGRITTTGVVAEFPLRANPPSFPEGVTSGPDGNVWFTEGNPAGAAIGSISTSGVVTEFPLPGSHSWPTSISAGTDASLWFTESSPSANQIGNIATSGDVLNEYQLPTPASWPSTIVTGPDGNLYFGESAPVSNSIAQLTPTGLLTEYGEPTASAFTDGVTVGPDGNLWFSEGLANQIGSMSLATVTSARSARVATSARVSPRRSTPDSIAMPSLGRNAQRAPRVAATKPSAPRVPTVVTGAATPNTVIRTFLNGQGQTINLPYGQGTGCLTRGDFGWAHIMDKHVLGDWNCGGIITTYPDAVGAATEEAVQSLIYMALQQTPTVESGSGRFIYQWPVPGTTYPIQVVVGNDGVTIITAYPLQT